MKVQGVTLSAHNVIGERTDSKLVEKKQSQEGSNQNKISSKKSEISLNRSSSSDFSSHDSFLEENEGKRGMYKISKESFD